MLWIPPGFAHGFLTLSDFATIQYKATHYYAPHFERTIQWNDPNLGINWPLKEAPVLSIKDAAALSFEGSEVYDWPNQRYATLSEVCPAY
jgi:dTDP-4-dehydrorhamnose 3,5-epimerase